MTKVSSGKPKKGPPAHQNSYAFHHNKSSKLTKHITSLPIRFLCPACVAVIEWRKKFRKYKPLTVVKKCTACNEKKIKDAYHVICGDCVRVTLKCAKCLLPSSQWINENEVSKEPIDKVINNDDDDNENSIDDENDNESNIDEDDNNESNTDEDDFDDSIDSSHSDYCDESDESS